MLVLGLSLMSCFPAAWALDVPDVDVAGPRPRPARKDVALVVAVEDYAALPDARYARADADAMEGFLVGFVGVPIDRVTRLDDPDTRTLAEAIPEAADEARKGGTLWVYFAGHGAAGARGQRLLLGADAAGEADAVSGVSVAWLLNAAGKSDATRVVAVIDAGFGGVGRAGEELYPDKRFRVADLPPSTDPRVAVWLATSGAEPAGVFTEARHGLFTWAAVGALRGWADGAATTPADRVVQLGEAQEYAQHLVRQLGGTGQRPTRELRADVTEWPMARAVDRAPDERVLTRLAAITRAERVRVRQEALYARARRDWADVERAWQAAGGKLTQGSEAERALQVFLARYDTATVQVDGDEIAVVVPQTTEARARLDQIARATPKSRRRSRRSKAPPPPPPPNPAIEGCLDLEALEEPALAGRLTADDVECLEIRVAIEPSQTVRDKVSRVLLVDADARGDDLEWARLAARHLETIDRSDPDLCLKYALILSRGDIEDAEDVIRWAGVGLENKYKWVGTTHLARVYGLFRVRAEAASRLWQAMELDRATDPSSVDEELLSILRGRARDFAREWLDYARTSGQPDDRARSLCESAAASAAFCAAE